MCEQFLTSKHKMIYASFLMTLFKIIRDEIIRIFAMGSLCLVK